MKITLCGSTRFMERYHTANRVLTLQGHVVYSVAAISTGAAALERTNVASTPPTPWPGASPNKRGDLDEPLKPSEKVLQPVVTPEQKTVLDLVHLKKILESDAIVVIGWRGLDDDYVGESTRREVAWAMMHDKEIYRENSVPNLELLNAYNKNAIVEVLDPAWPKSANLQRQAECGDPDCVHCAPTRN